MKPISGVLRCDRSPDRAAALLPHLDHADHPESSTANVARMATEVPVPTYGIDDETAIKVTDDSVEVVSEGHWKRFTR
jgi:dipeptidase E